MREDLRVQSVDGSGIVVSKARDRAVDVLFDDHRVWSFWVHRDTEPAGVRTRRAVWPPPLTRYLSGRTRVVVRDAGDGAVLFDREVRFGEADERVDVVNKQGLKLGMDKSGRLVPTFETRDRRDIAGLVDAVQEVLEVLRGAGAAPFVGYGTLLGAVREGAVLGHDSDADICYVSEHRFPVDVVRESFRLQRAVSRLGYQTIRYSGAAFKIRVVEGDGFARGLDVFAGFFDEDHLYLMGEVGTPFEREWLLPLGTASLNGVEVPVPARPDKLLEAMYGPGWRTPDPAFKFETSSRTKRALNNWFRGLRPDFDTWQRRYAVRKHVSPRRRPSQMARRACEEALRTGATVLDVGAGKGGDALWLARKGVPVIAYDYIPHALDTASAIAREEGLRLEVRPLNLTEWRSTFGEGARLAWTPARRVVLAQHLLDATTRVGRDALASFCSLATREGGSLYAQFHLDETVEDVEWARRLEVDDEVARFRAAGARDVTTSRRAWKGRPDVVQLVATW